MFEIIFSAPKFGSELKRRASDVSLPSSAANHRPASLNLTYSQRGAPGKEKSKKAVKAVKQRTIKFHEYKVRKIHTVTFCEIHFSISRNFFMTEKFANQFSKCL